MTKKELQIILEAFERMENSILTSIDKFKEDISIHPQDIADQELKDIESEADLIHSQEEDRVMEDNADRIENDLIEENTTASNFI